MSVTSQLCRVCVRSSVLVPCRVLQPKHTAVLQWKRHKTIVMERVFPLPPGKYGGLPGYDEVNELHKILRHVGRTDYPQEMECILTDFVEGVGIRGDVVKVERSLFHEELYPASLAVYASPENLSDFEEERKAKGIEKTESRLGVFARMTIKELNHLDLKVPMNLEENWTLDKSHVQVAFRLQGIELDQDCIVLPEEPITELGEFTVQVKVNQLETVAVEASVVHIADTYAAT